MFRQIKNKQTHNFIDSDNTWDRYIQLVNIFFGLTYSFYQNGRIHTGDRAFPSPNDWRHLGADRALMIFWKDISSHNSAARSGGLSRIVTAMGQDRAGSIALLFAIVLPVLFAVTAGAIDFASALRQKSRLQQVVDAAALAAASELSMSNSKTENVSGIIEALVQNYLEAAYTTSKYPVPNVQTSIRTEPLQVEVRISQSFVSFFGDPLGLQNADMEAGAVAQVMGQPNVCVLALHPSTNGALSLEQRARVTAKDCGVFSNSTHNTGIKTKQSATLKAATICSAGGVQGGGDNFDPPPYLDCPTFEDPLAHRPEPNVGNCSHGKPTRISTARRLRPGTYCGLILSAGARVELEPGIYIIKDGPLSLSGGAMIRGSGVGFFLSGKRTYLDFAGDSTVRLKAPTTGLMAGLLIFASRKTTRGNQHKIFSENAQVMVGTVYIPTGQLLVDGAANVGRDSAYTAIVAETIRLYGGPHIVLNTKYDETDVPVPDGIRGAGQPIQIVQ